MRGEKASHAQPAPWRIRWFIAFPMLGLLGLMAAGCGTGPASAQAAQPAATATPPPDSTDASPERTLSVFDHAKPLAVDGDSTAAVSGTILSPGQVDAYDIGLLAIGDQLTVELDTDSNGLDPVLSVFDQDENSIFINDDRAFYAGQLDCYGQFVNRRSLARCLVVVSSSGRSETTGAYRLTVTRNSGQSVASPAEQYLYLDFRGADDVVIGRRPAVDIPTFSGTMIGPEFAAHTDELMTRITQRVSEDFTGFNVLVSSSSAQTPPVVPYTTIYFGSYNAALLGISDNIDSFNGRPAQRAIVFVDTFAAFLPLDPTVEEIADALANVASHEAGHLLGLHHSCDPREIMDTSASLRQMLTPQSFLRAPLAADAFPAGYQDAPQRLLDAVGGSPVAAQARAKLRTQYYRDEWYDQGPAVPARSLFKFAIGPADD